MRRSAINCGLIAKRAAFFGCPIVAFLVGVTIVAHNTIGNPSVYTGDPWPYSEWLINYAGGFVRRGLSGEIIAWARGDDAATSVINHIVFWNYAVFSALLVVLIFISASCSLQAGLLAVMLPGGLLDIAKGNDFFQRKETLAAISLEVMCIMAALLLRSPSRRVSSFLLTSLVVWTFLSSIFLSFVHEAYFFLQMPAAYLVLRFLAQTPVGAGHIRFAPACFVVMHCLLFLIAVVFKGDPQAAQKIWTSLSSVDRTFISPAAPDSPAGGILAVGYSLLKGVAHGMSVILSSGLWLWIFIVGCMAFIAMLIATYQNGETSRKTEGPTSQLNVLVFLFVVSLPMYIVGSDWGRWIESTMTAFLILSFAFADRTLSPPAFFPGTQCAAPLLTFIERNKAVLFLVALAFSLTFRYPECCLGMRGPTALEYLRPLVKDTAISLGATMNIRY